MSGTDTGRQPRTDAEWAREVSRRLAKLEDPNAARVGEWVITTRSGELVAAKEGQVVPLLNPNQSVDREAVSQIVRSSGFAKQTDLDATNTTVANQGGQIGGILGDITGIFEDLTDLFSGLGVVQDEIADVITRLDEVEATFAVTPAYIADIQDMATCARKDLTVIRYTSGSAGSMSCDDASHSHSAHSHTLSSSFGCFTYKPSAPTFASTAPVDYTPIVVDREGIVDTLRWVVGSDSSLFGIDVYYIALCVYNPSNGNIEKVWDSGDIKDGVANTTTLQEVGIQMGINQPCTPGQLLYVAHMQTAPGVLQESRTFAAAPDCGIARPSSLAPLDACTFRTPDSYGSIPSSVSAASLQRINSYTPWAAVKVLQGA